MEPSLPDEAAPLLRKTILILDKNQPPLWAWKTGWESAMGSPSRCDH
jgi:hypothetical protein